MRWQSEPLFLTSRSDGVVCLTFSRFSPKASYTLKQVWHKHGCIRQHRYKINQFMVIQDGQTDIMTHRHYKVVYTQLKYLTLPSAHAQIQTNKHWLKHRQIHKETRTGAAWSLKKDGVMGGKTSSVSSTNRRKNWRKTWKPRIAKLIIRRYMKQ